jgi:uncharacterized membrane protein
MTIDVLALLIGVIAGMRAMSAPAAVAWAASLGWLPLQGTPLAWLGHAVTPWILTLLGLGELVADKLPRTPSRKVPVQFGTRIVSGAIAGAAIGAAGSGMVAGLALGALGAVIGTMAGAAARARLARTLGRDLPAALVEDVVAVGGAILIVMALR